MLLKDLNVEIELLVVIHCNNIGSIKIATNPGVNLKTRHIIEHYHFTREKLVTRKDSIRRSLTYVHRNRWQTLLQNFLEELYLKSSEKTECNKYI